MSWGNGKTLVMVIKLGGATMNDNPEVRVLYLQKRVQHEAKLKTCAYCSQSRPDQADRCSGSLDLVIAASSVRCRNCVALLRGPAYFAQ